MTCAGRCPFGSGDLFRCAIRYAELGYAVYPCSNSGTMAQHRMMGTFDRGMGGFKIATADVSVVKSWERVWRQPDVTIGMATGTPSHLLVVDFDLKPKAVENGATSGPVSFGDVLGLDHTPEEKFREWARERNVVVPGNVQVATPSGGRHLWLRTVVEGSRQIRWMENVDLLWNKHSIKAPPSVRPASDRKPGGTYRFERGCACEVPEAPPELIEAFENTPATGRVHRPGQGAGSGECGSDEDGPRVDIDTPRRIGIPVGQQNSGLWDMACSHAGRGLPASEALQALVDTVQASAQDEKWPWELDDLADLVERAYLWKATERSSILALTSKITF